MVEAQRGRIRAESDGPGLGARFTFTLPTVETGGGEAANTGNVLTYERLLERVWGRKGVGDLRPMRAIINKLRRRLGDDADRPTYVFTEPLVGYWVSSGEGRERT